MQPTLWEFDLLAASFKIVRLKHPKKSEMSQQELAKKFMDAIGTRLPALRTSIDNFPDHHDAAWKIATDIIKDNYLCDSIDGKTFLDFFKSNLQHPKVTLDSALIEELKKLRARHMEFENERKRRELEDQSPSNASLSEEENTKTVATTQTDSPDNESTTTDDETKRKHRYEFVSAFTPEDLFAAYNKTATHQLNLDETLELLRAPEKFPNPFEVGQPSASQPATPTKQKEITDEELRNFEIYKTYEEKGRGILQDYYLDQALAACELQVINVDLKTLHNHLDKLISDYPWRMFNDRLNQARKELQEGRKGIKSEEQRQQYDRYLKGGKTGFDDFFEDYKKERSTRFGKTMAKAEKIMTSKLKR
ncbi:MAG TPA: hypothetical protein VM532_04010 [Burkholderiales bacterium]|nr:hypothetical protein [Burkholderiales bacterium]